MCVRVSLARSPTTTTYDMRASSTSKPVKLNGLLHVPTQSWSSSRRNGSTGTEATPTFVELETLAWLGSRSQRRASIEQPSVEVAAPLVGGSMSCKRRQQHQRQPFFAGSSLTILAPSKAVLSSSKSALFQVLLTLGVSLLFALQSFDSIACEELSTVAGDKATTNSKTPNNQNIELADLLEIADAELNSKLTVSSSHKSVIKLIDTVTSNSIGEKSSLFLSTPAPVEAQFTSSSSSSSATSTEQQSVKNCSEPPEESQDEPTAERDDNDAPDCEGISAHESAEGQKYTDNERLVNLQACIQGKIKHRLLSATRSGMDMFDKLSMSGGCTASLFNLMSSLGAIKSFAFKFLDASAKIPSGVMYGLLSDFGDFDQCLSIRSNPNVDPENEADEGAYSGKYCLMSAKLNYRVRLEPNQTVPEGIVPDGLLWDELVRNYWTSKSSKGFQIGLCLPSRCTTDDLEQLYKYVAQSYNVIGQVINCQDSSDLKRQYTPDLVQRLILMAIYLLLLVTSVASLTDRYYYSILFGLKSSPTEGSPGYLFSLLMCFSIARNWRKFTRQHQDLYQNQIVRESFLTSHANDLLAINHHRQIGRSRQEPSTEQTSMGSPIPVRDDERAVSLSMEQDINVDTNNLDKTCQLNVTIQQNDLTRLSNLQNQRRYEARDILSHLNGLRLLVIIWITIGHSFLYPSANNYQYYRSIININFTRDSVWFATTNFTLGIDTLLYISGLTFVYKLIQHKRSDNVNHSNTSVKRSHDIIQLLLHKVLRFWPTYMTLIALAIMVPLLSDGPMWPEMVNKRLGTACRNNWWTNLLFVSNFLPQSEICIPSSWFISILMQLFLIGAIIIFTIRRLSLLAGLSLLFLMLIGSSVFSFTFAYMFKVRAPAIKMDESFVMELDETIFRLYTNIFNNLGPFLIGMLGGLLLVHAKYGQSKNTSLANSPLSSRSGNQIKVIKSSLATISLDILIALIAMLVLSSVFHQEYTLFWSSIYWSMHRVGWALVTGYVIHNCATQRWTLLNDLLSLSTFLPLSKLILIAYLVYPMFIYMHSGLVRDGLHVSIYNMLNIYTTRLVMTFTTALFIHLLVELPTCSIEELVTNRLMIARIGKTEYNIRTSQNKSHPLLAVAQMLSIKQDNTSQKLQTNGDKNKVQNPERDLESSVD